MVQRNDTRDHDAMITPKERFYGSAKRKTAARSETRAGTQLADMNKSQSFTSMKIHWKHMQEKFINFYCKKKIFIFAPAK